MEERLNKFEFSKDSAIFEPKKKHKLIKDKKKLFYNLAVYKAAIDLVSQLYKSTNNAPTAIRYGIIERMAALLISIISNIAFAASSKDKVVWLKNAFVQAKRIQILIRILYDIRAISESGFSALSSKSEDLCRLLYGWRDKCVLNLV